MFYYQNFATNLPVNQLKPILNRVGAYLFDELFGGRKKGHFAP